MKHRLWLAGVVASVWAVVPASVAQADEPVVRAALFYSPSYGHSHIVIDETLPPLFEQ